MQGTEPGSGKRQGEADRRTTPTDEPGTQTVVAWGGFLATAFLFLVAHGLLDNRDPSTLAAGLALVLALAVAAGTWWLLQGRPEGPSDLGRSAASLVVALVAALLLVVTVRSGATQAWQPLLFLPSAVFLVLAVLGLLPGILGRAAVLGGGVIVGSYLVLVASFGYGGGLRVVSYAAFTVLEVALGGCLVAVVAGLGSRFGDGDWPSSLVAASGRIALLSITVAILAFVGTLDVQAEAARTASRRAIPHISGLLTALVVGVTVLALRGPRGAGGGTLGR